MATWKRTICHRGMELGEEWRHMLGVGELRRLSYFYFRKITFKKWDTGIPHLIILFFIVLCLHCISFLFLQTEGLWQPCVEQVYQEPKGTEEK